MCNSIYEKTNINITFIVFINKLFRIVIHILIYNIHLNVIFLIDFNYFLYNSLETSSAEPIVGVSGYFVGNSLLS